MDKFQGFKFLPLLNTRDVLIVLEILSFGLEINSNINPPIVIYHNKNRLCNAFTFRKEILFQFSRHIFEDIMFILKPPSNVINTVTDEIARRLVHNFYDTQQLNQGLQFLDGCILLKCAMDNNTWNFEFLQQVVWNDIETMHWRIYFAKMLIEYA